MSEARVPPNDDLPRDVQHPRQASGEDSKLAAATSSAHVAIARYFLLLTAQNHGVISTRDREELPALECDVRRVVNAVVQQYRTLALPPERVLIHLKELLAPFPHEEHDIVETVRQRVILWGIEEYYKDGGR